MTKRDVLAALERDELLEAVDAHGLEVADRRRRDEPIEALLQCRDTLAIVVALGGRLAPP